MLFMSLRRGRTPRPPCSRLGVPQGLALSRNASRNRGEILAKAKVVLWPDWQYLHVHAEVAPALRQRCVTDEQIVSRAGFSGAARVLTGFGLLSRPAESASKFAGRRNGFGRCDAPSHGAYIAALAQHRSAA